MEKLETDCRVQEGISELKLLTQHCMHYKLSFQGIFNLNHS